MPVLSPPAGQGLIVMMNSERILYSISPLCEAFDTAQQFYQSHHHAIEIRTKRESYHYLQLTTEVESVQHMPEARGETSDRVGPIREVSATQRMATEGGNGWALHATS